MKQLVRGCAVTISLVLGLAVAGEKLAVIGDSISTGAHAVDRERNGYPPRLITLFAKKGEREMKVFAVSGHTLLLETEQSLMKRPGYQEILDYAADVVVIMLGTNDTSLNERNRHWEAHQDLEKDLRKMIADLKAANPKVMIHLAGPPPMFPDKEGLKPQRVEDLTKRKARLLEVEAVLSAVAGEEPGVVHHGMSRVLTAEETSDGVHPSTFAHERIAHHLDELLKLPYDEAFDVGRQLEKAGVKAELGRFHGFVKHDFKLPGSSARCVVVAPEQAVEGRPWIWRARFFGHQPSLDLSLLDRGWHVAYCDVSNLFGAPEAMARWDAFYAFARDKLGFGRKPIMEGMSRGGLPVFRWASRHPEQVSAIYGDNPVCDFNSWPGGNHGKRSEREWKRLLEIWEITEDEAAEHEQVVDWLGPLAKAKVPVALVLGMADEVVPVAENGEKVAKRYASLGGPSKVWRKPGAGHHPHGLNPVAPLRRFLLTAAGAERNPAVLPSPSSEYRGAAAGWGGGSWWDASII